MGVGCGKTRPPLFCLILSCHPKSMTFDAFTEIADGLWDDIPERFKRGLHGVHVLEYLKPDPNDAGLVRLGEYRHPGFPSVLGGFEGIGRHIVLYYGSFARVAAGRARFDWEGEIWETLIHELRHHLETLAWNEDLVKEDMQFLREYRHAKKVDG